MVKWSTFASFLSSHLVIAAAGRQLTGGKYGEMTSDATAAAAVAMVETTVAVGVAAGTS